MTTRKLEKPEEQGNTPQPTNENIRRLALWLGFWKFALVSFVLAMLSAVLNYQIQTRTITIREKEQEKEYVKSFVDKAMDDNLEKRVRFAQYFAALLKEGWVDYNEVLQKELAEERSKASKAKEELNKLTSSGDAAAQKKAEELSRVIATLEANITPRLPTEETDAVRVMYCKFGEQAAGKGSEWNEQLFAPVEGTRDSGKTPESGRVYEALDEVTLRGGFPTYVSGIGISFRPAVGVIKKGQRVLIVDIRSYPLKSATHWWIAMIPQDR